MEIAAKMVLTKTTKGALQYKEVDEEGKPIEIANAKFGGIYIRKQQLDGREPKEVTVTVTF